MKYLAISAFLFVLSGSAWAQNVSYKILSDDPRDIKGTSLSLEPFYADVHNANMTLGFNVRAEALILKRFEVRGEFRKAYLDINANGNSANSNLPLGVNGLKKATYMEAGMSLFFADRNKKKNLRVVLSSFRSGNYQVTRYINVPGTVRRMTGLHGGVFYQNTAFTIEDDMTFAKAKNKETGELKSFDFSGSNFYEANTMMRTVTLYAGLTWKTITSLVCETDYGVKGNSGMNDFFIDFLFAPVISLQDVKQGTTRYELVFDKGHVKHMGWRAGWNFRSPKKTWLCYKAEFGSRPGLQQSRKFLDNQKAYLLLTMGINIPMKIKKIENSNE